MAEMIKCDNGICEIRYSKTLKLDEGSVDFCSFRRLEPALHELAGIGRDRVLIGIRITDDGVEIHSRVRDV